MITIESLKEIIEDSFKETPSEDTSSAVPSPKLTDQIQEIFTQALELERKMAALHEREIGWMQEIRNMQKELDSPVIYQLTYDRFWGMRGSQGVLLYILIGS